MEIAVRVWLQFGGGDLRESLHWRRYRIYTQYCIWCHTVFYGTVITFLMTLLMNKYTSFVTDDGNLDEIHVNY